MIKIIAADMDGTLLNSNHKISQNTAKAIRSAQEMGIEFIITTGRIYEEAFPELEEVDVNCKYLAMNGAELRDEKGSILQSIEIDKNLVKDIVSHLEKKGLFIEANTSNGTYMIGTKEAFDKVSLERIEIFFPHLSSEEAKVEIEEYNKLRNFKNVDSIDDVLSENIKIFKIQTLSKNIDLIKENIDELFSINNISVTASFPQNIEITNISAQKGPALAAYAESKGIRMEEVMAIGDSKNDLSMLAMDFGATVAMGNAREEIKNVAKYETLDNDHDGVAVAITKVIDGKL